MRGLFAIIVLLLGVTSTSWAADQSDAAADAAVKEFYAGHAALQQGDPSAAIADFSKALEIGNLEETQVAYVHHYRAIAYQRLDRHQEAIDDYTRALAIGTLPKRVQAAIYYNRAIALDHLANFERAIKDYTQAIALKADYAEAYMNRGNAYRKLGDNNAALRDYQSSAAYGNPIKHLPYYGEGLVLEAKGDKQAAFKAFQTALLLAPDFEPARLKVEGYQAAGMTPSIASGTTAATRPAKPSGPTEVAVASAQQTAPASSSSDMQINLKPAYRLPRTQDISGVTGATGAAASTTPKTVSAPAPAKAAASSASATKPQTATKTPTPPGGAAVAPAMVEDVPSGAKPKSPSGPPPDVAAAVPSAVGPSTASAKPATPTAGSEGKPATPATSSASLGSGSYRVQVGAFLSQDIAQTQAAQILTKYGDLLTGLDQDIERADLGAKGVYYRLRFGPFSSKSDAGSRCSQLKSRGQACIIVAGAAG